MFVSIDYTFLNKSNDGHENVLVMTDVFIKFAVAVLTRAQTALTTIGVLVREWFQRYQSINQTYTALISPAKTGRYGVPIRIHSDHGKTFERSLVQELLISMPSKSPEQHPIILKGMDSVRFSRSLIC